ncbi:hypothetical protein V6N13_142447 [Hibiscus sabdariffa]
MVSRFVVVKRNWIKDNWSCGIIEVYAPYGVEDQMEERQRCSSISRGMPDFGEFLELNALLDISFLE